MFTSIIFIAIVTPLLLLTACGPSNDLILEDLRCTIKSDLTEKEYLFQEVYERDNQKNITESFYFHYITFYEDRSLVYEIHGDSVTQIKGEYRLNFEDLSDDYDEDGFDKDPIVESIDIAFEDKIHGCLLHTWIRQSYNCNSFKFRDTCNGYNYHLVVR